VRTLPSTWFVPLARRPQARLRLFCFPYAGGGSAIFRSWSDVVPDLIEPFAAMLPGRDARFGETPLRDAVDLARQLADAIEPELDRPYATFGHSLGTVVSYELALELARRGLPAPCHMIMSGRGAPHLMRGGRDCDALDDAAFIEELRDMQGTPEEVLANGELMQMLLPTLRADFAMARNYRRQQPEPLACGLSVYGGLSDLGVGRETLQAWQEYTRAPVALRMFPGGHFFINGARHLVLQALVRDLYPFAAATASVA
jgi:medium-chain acyl-[acyl-carrier-protein] hydrolase